MSVAMEMYRHFGLRVSPFEGKPDPRFFYGSASHVETLSALQYAAQSGKTCTVVFGEAGSGKTLLGLMLSHHCAGRSSVLWLHGLGKANGQPDLHLWHGGELVPCDQLSGRDHQPITLTDCLRKVPVLGQGAVVIVDDADELPDSTWEEILALLATEIHSVRQTSLILLGQPELAVTLSGPGFQRLQRRVFRVCPLAPLSSPEVAAYVRHRLTVAGAVQPEIFTADALKLVHRASRGNPALINQICDNAMIEAFGEDSPQVGEGHVADGLHAISAGTLRRRELSVEGLAQPSLPPVPSLADLCGLPKRLRRAIGAALAPCRIPPIRQVEQPDPTCAALDERLNLLKGRLTGTVERVQAACRRVYGESGPPECGSAGTPKE